MAIYDSITIGNGRKSLGNVTLAKLKTQNIAKQKISTTTNRNSAGQVTQRNQLRNTVAIWPYFRGFLAAAVSLPRVIESKYNAFVRIFINEVVSTSPASITEIMQSINSGVYGSGAPLKVISAEASAAGVTITYQAPAAVWPSGSQITAMIFDKSDGSISMQSAVITGQGSETVVVASPGISANEVGLVACYASNELGTVSGPIQVVECI